MLICDPSKPHGKCQDVTLVRCNDVTLVTRAWEQFGYVSQGTIAKHRNALQGVQNEIENTGTMTSTNDLTPEQNEKPSDSPMIAWYNFEVFGCTTYEVVHSVQTSVQTELSQTLGDCANSSSMSIVASDISCGTLHARCSTSRFSLQHQLSAVGSCATRRHLSHLSHDTVNNTKLLNHDAASSLTICIYRLGSFAHGDCTSIIKKALGATRTPCPWCWCCGEQRFRLLNCCPA